MVGYRVYVGGLPYGVRERDLERFFKGYGRTRDILIKNGYGFVEFEDQRDADDAVYELNGKELLERRIVVEPARGTARIGGRDRFDDRHGSRRGGGGRDKFYGPAFSTEYRLLVKNLSSRVSWKDLKDYMRQAGEVTYADAHKQRRNEGVVEFASSADMRNAIEKLDDTDLNGRRIRLIEDRPKSGRGRGRSRSSSSRSRSRHRSRSSRRGRSSRSRSRSRSHTKTRKSKSPAKRSSSRSRSICRDAAKSKSRSRSRSAKRVRTRSRSAKRDTPSRSAKRDTRSRSPAESDVKRATRSRSAHREPIAENGQEVAAVAAPADVAEGEAINKVPQPPPATDDVSALVNDNNNTVAAIVAPQEPSEIVVAAEPHAEESHSQSGSSPKLSADDGERRSRSPANERSRSRERSAGRKSRSPSPVTVRQDSVED